jgi:hypothetical protein
MGEGKVKKPQGLRIKADNWRIKIQDVQGTAKRTRGRLSLQTEKVA